MSQQTPEPGWYPDPTGRFEHRYWSGAGWTEWVLVAGSQQVDRFWEGTRIGGEVQRSSSSHPSAAVAAGSTGAPDPGAARPSRAALRDRLARPRPHASPHAAVAAVAGVAVVIGIVALAGEVPDRTAQALIGIVIAESGRTACRESVATSNGRISATYTKCRTRNTSVYAE